MLNEIRAGTIVTGDGAVNPARSGRQGELVTQDAHGQLYEANFRGALFSDGIGLTAINNATYTSGTLGATCTPILGVYNPSTNNVNLVIVQASLGVSITALQATGCGPFVWATSTLNPGISTGSQPLNRKTLVAAGSNAKGLGNVALTGLTNNLVVRGVSGLGGGSAASVAFLATQVAMQTPLYATSENINGAIIVPPGGVLALLATTTPVGHSAAGMIVWEEVPVA